MLVAAAGILVAAWSTVPHTAASQLEARHHQPGVGHRIDKDRSGAEAGESPRRDRV